MFACALLSDRSGTARGFLTIIISIHILIVWQQTPILGMAGMATSNRAPLPAATYGINSTPTNYNGYYAHNTNELQESTVTGPVPGYHHRSLKHHLLKQEPQEQQEDGQRLPQLQQQYPPPSRQNPSIPPMEMEIEMQPSPGTPEWKKRKGWFKNTRTHRMVNHLQQQQEQEQQQKQQQRSQMPDNIGNCEMMYYQGAKMEVDTPMTTAPAQYTYSQHIQLPPAATSRRRPTSPLSSSLQKEQQFPPDGTAVDNLGASSASSTAIHYVMQEQTPAPAAPLQPPALAAPVQRIPSFMTRSSTDTLIDFDESEWTPADSSYGAAIPIMGWIPKNIRRMIEYTLIGVLVVIFVYFVVFTSLQITESQHNGENNQNTDGGLNLDDDRYIPVTNDDQYQSYNMTDDTYRYQQGGGDYRRMTYYHSHSSDDNDDHGFLRGIWERLFAATTNDHKTVLLRRNDNYNDDDAYFQE